MPLPSLPDRDQRIAAMQQHLPDETFKPNEIADDCDCTSCVEVHRSALSIHGTIAYEKLLVAGSLALPNNPDLRRLPELLAVLGRLDLSGCANLELVSRGLYVGDSADLSNTPIDNLPEKTIVKGKLVLNACENLKEVTEGTTCLSLSARDATNLRRIPGNREYLDLDLSGSGIEELPEGLTVKRSLKLEGCRNLTRIPEGTRIGLELNVRGCTNLFKLPKSLQPKDVRTDSFWVSETGLFMPYVEDHDADMMLGRPAREVIQHHLLERLEILKHPIRAIRKTSAMTSGWGASSAELDTPAAAQARLLRSRTKRRG